MNLETKGFVFIDTTSNQVFWCYSFNGANKISKWDKDHWGAARNVRHEDIKNYKKYQIPYLKALYYHIKHVESVTKHLKHEIMLDTIMLFQELIPKGWEYDNKDGLPQFIQRDNKAPYNEYNVLKLILDDETNKKYTWMLKKSMGQWSLFSMDVGIQEDDIRKLL